VDRYTASGPSTRAPATEKRAECEAGGGVAAEERAATAGSAAAEPAATAPYRRDRTTWAVFGALFAFGFVNAVLGPALPYLRAVEHISYLVGALHQAAYAVGGGVAGLLAARDWPSLSRTTWIAGGLTGAALAGLAVGYGGTPALTIAGALVMSMLATAALIRLWAVLADLHGARRAVAMSEGEVSVSLAGILTPLLIGALAATALSWRFAFVVGAATAGAGVLWVVRAGLPPPAAGPAQARSGSPSPGSGWRQPTLIGVFAIVALEFALSFWLASYLNDDIGLARGAAVAAVSGLYAAALVGRVLVSRLARRAGAERLLAAALSIALLGMPALLLATDALVAAVGIAVTGIGIGMMFPLTSALHVKASPLSADSAVGQVLAVAAPGQLVGPLVVGAIAQAAGLRAGLLILPALTLLAAAGLFLHRNRG
jgi:fucose permease